MCKGDGSMTEGDWILSVFLAIFFVIGIKVIYDIFRERWE